MQKNGNESFSVDAWVVEPALNRISYRNVSHYLRPQVMDLLVYLARRNGRVVSTEDLLTDLWVGRVVSHGTVYNCVAELRQALTNGHDSGGEIENIPKKGYRLVANVRGVFDDAISAPGVHLVIESESRRLNYAQLAYWSGAALVLVVTVVAFFSLRVTPLSISAATQLSTSQVLFPAVPSTFPLVTDGSRIYFNDWLSGLLGLRQMLVSGGDAIRMESPFDDAELLINPQTVTPDGANLMVTTFHPGSPELPSLWLWPILDGPPRRIGAAGYAVFSADGSRIAYSNQYGELLIADQHMQNPKVLAKLPGRIFWPVFSPDGQRIRFSLGRGDGLPNTLWEISLAGGEAKRLLPDWAARSHCCGSWMPDGSKFIFQAIDNGRSQIWVSAESAGMFGDSSQEPYLLTRGPIDFRRPTIAPEGDRLFAVGWQLRGEIVRYDSRTENFVAIPELESVSAEWLAYAGNHLAYISYPDATLWISNRDGTDPQQLSFSPLRALNPVWSPDGSTIAFEGLKPGRQKRIFMVSLDSRAIVEATAGDVRQVSPTWSADGSKIAFNELDKEEIQVLELATGEVVSLVGTKGLFAPSWSANGQTIAALGRDGLVLYDVKSGAREVLAGQVPIERHYWDSSNEHIFFYDFFWLGDARSLYKVNVRSKAIERIAAVGGVRSTFGIGGMWLGPGPDDEPILLRDLSIHHIYELDFSSD